MQFGGQPVLQAIDLSTFSRGQTLVVIGESGCGKTVLLKIMIGLLRPTVGRVLFDGKSVVRSAATARSTKQRLRFGFLFQGAALFDSLTVYDNVAFGLHAHGGRPEAEIHEIVRQRLQEVGLPASVMAKKPAELSGGMKKRVGLARALALEPGSHALRRADDRPRPDHDRRHQRVDPANAPQTAGDERGRDA